MRDAIAAAALLLSVSSSAFAQYPIAFHGGGLGSGGTPRSIVTADFNGDGHVDFAAANYFGSTNSLGVWLWSPTNGFFKSYFYAVDAGPFGIATADFNHDSRPDVAVTSADANVVTVMTWNGDGFTLSARLVAAGNPREIVAADFNRDGNVDLAYTLYDCGCVEIALNQGNGHDWRPGIRAPAAAGTHGLAVADFNRDGILDLVATNAIANKASVLFGDGSGQFPTKTTVSLGRSPRNVAVGDFNRDGFPDFVSINTDSNDVTVYLGTNGTAFTKVASPLIDCGTGCIKAGNSPRDVEMADINGDGLLDLLIADYGDDTLMVWTGNGAGQFGDGPGPYQFNSVKQPRTLALGDFNEDGRVDVLVGNQGNGAVIIFFNDTPFKGR